MPTLRDQIKPYLDQVKSRELTNRALARLVDASESHICRLLKQMKVVRNPAPTRENKRALISEREAFRRGLAQQTVEGRITVAEAARQAHCSERTIYRYRNRP